MNTEQFLQLLRESGFPEPVEVQRVANGHLEIHEHPFAVKALVIEGSIDINIEGTNKSYREGDFFHLSFKQAHAESYGPEGVKYLASRKE